MNANTNTIVQELSKIGEIEYLGYLVKFATYGGYDINEASNILDKFRGLSPNALESRGHYLVAKASNILKSRLSSAFSVQTPKLAEHQVIESLKVAFMETIKDYSKASKDRVLSYLKRFNKVETTFEYLKEALLSFKVPSISDIQSLIHSASSYYIESYLDELIEQIQVLKGTPNLQAKYIQTALNNLNNKTQALVEKVGESKHDGYNLVLNFLEKSTINASQKAFSIGVPAIDEGCLHKRGLKRGESLILAAPPSSGKTGVIVSSLTHQIKELSKEYAEARAIEDLNEQTSKLTQLERSKILFFSTEMKTDMIINRLVQSFTQSFDDYTSDLTTKKGNEIVEFVESCRDVLENNVKIYGPEYSSIEKILAVCEEENEKGNLSLVYVDYLQNVKSDDMTFSADYLKERYVSKRFLEFKNESNAAWIFAASCNELDFSYNGFSEPNMIIRGSKDAAYDADYMITISKPKVNDEVSETLNNKSIENVRYFHAIKTRSGQEGGRAIAVLRPGFNFEIVHTGRFNTKNKELNYYSKSRLNLSRNTNSKTTVNSNNISQNKTNFTFNDLEKVKNRTTYKDSSKETRQPRYQFNNISSRSVNTNTYGGYI